jgi:hypothetical protein
MKVQTRPLSPRPRFRRFALALAALAHMLAIVVAPIVEAAAERNAEAHVEDVGTRDHRYHSETTCIVCAGHPLVAITAPQVFRLTDASMRSPRPATFALPPLRRAAGAPVGSRAPPTIA